MDGRIRQRFPRCRPETCLLRRQLFGRHVRRAKAPTLLWNHRQSFLRRCLGLPLSYFRISTTLLLVLRLVEVMCSTYKAFGSVGLITSGGGRFTTSKSPGLSCVHRIGHLLACLLPNTRRWCSSASGRLGRTNGRPASWRRERGHQHSSGFSFGSRGRGGRIPSG